VPIVTSWLVERLRIVAQPDNVLLYKRSRFTTRLPTDRLYAPSHFWIAEVGHDTYHVGFTKFATRMLGDIVEHGFESKPGDEIIVGQTIGWIEGFKAITDLYAVANGKFLGENTALKQDITLVDSDPYGAGWLYSFRGVPEPNSVDVHGYTEILDATIDKMQQMPSVSDEDQEKDPQCPT
jgi:glycine cleavage system H protein